MLTLCYVFIFLKNIIAIRVDFPLPGIQSFGFEFRNPF